ncbi:MAG: hypothetical protein KDI46_07695 [Alphaproteobacteria bacterium]|nr:hypothetical protein [Alphaproteobacteria bacterium]
MSLNEKKFREALGNINRRALSRFNQAQSLQNKQEAVRDFCDGFASLSRLAGNDNVSDELRLEVSRILSEWSQRGAETGYRA